MEEETAYAMVNHREVAVEVSFIAVQNVVLSYCIIIFPGATDIRIGGEELYNRVIVAGGGGGSTTDEVGGNSDYIGGSGSGCSAGTGGSQSSGGTGCNVGATGYGGTGCGIGSAGGGGGWFGGGGGGSGSTNNAGSGGGGKCRLNYIDLLIFDCFGFFSIVGSSYSDYPLAEFSVSPTYGNGSVEFTYTLYQEMKYFNYSGDVQTFTVPPHVFSMTVTIAGAGGGSGTVVVEEEEGSVPGGCGVVIVSTIPTSFSSYHVYIGGKGMSYEGGFNGGGNGNSSITGSNMGGGGGK